jgi:hypothetical protein
MSMDKIDKIVLAVIAYLMERGWEVLDGGPDGYEDLVAAARFNLLEFQTDKEYQRWAKLLEQIGWKVDLDEPGDEPGWRTLMRAHYRALGKQIPQAEGSDETVVLSKRDFMMFIKHLERPRKPNKALKDAMAKYRERYGL